MKHNTSICLCRVYEVADDIDLEKAKAVLAKQETGIFKLKKFNREMVINDAPLTISLGDETYSHLGLNGVAIFSGKVWSFGAISLTIQIKVESEISMGTLMKLVDALETDQNIEQQALNRIVEISAMLAPTCNKPSLWEEVEDYTIIQFENMMKENSEDFEISRDGLLRLIEGESETTLSDQTKESYQKWIYQYSTEDLLILDWNRAIMAAQSQEILSELTDILEFAVVQLFELRFYDNVLDKNLNSLYRSIQKNPNPFWNNKYSQLSKEASLQYIDIHEVIDMINNSLKVIGDSYYASVYRGALERFRINDWKKGISDKADNLADISSLLSTDINEKRNQLLEIVIIILIAIEVVPLIYKLVQSYS